MSIRSSCPSQHLAALDAALPTDPVQKSAVGGVLQNLLALLESLGLTISWPCLIAAIPQIIAAFANPALIPAIIVAYLACAHPPTP